MDISVPIYIESRYKVNRKRIKQVVSDTVRKGGIVTPVEVSVAIVGNRKIRALNKKYRNIDKTTNVLSFSQIEGKGSPRSPDKLYLGDVVISYPFVILEAASENMLVDDKIAELVEHGVKHLLGEHH
ncbi:MAG: rRNA maturation RNase YbeY [Candidatus Levybacteria bacterium RIFCSPHIGHO2_02_FULL_40_18]|nr:MAG: rRNA maturation RNase YbeY [Candidatus Levybacteria bacterium RIFCSPHIGHO2_01_FULL_40_58]OGH26738.1 MAG: rRNA maturation RNase YbeY [Candidatus Levybacteria bacterium RIFCSPHIGHO2_02_FULL_40_18]OGH31673.1 MAG: rRNA maturation RNase YbeY [Candidatus Levybacteria bacterium RIFCSPHIGHO2_12_FULL_40_31]OGH40573.1 MAG: rRNA maturation RNase YbeY [Candidatus Levybacteria bacterium RIFCSPLOWO2_01_FULL_40_64]OGH48748.1 MAG: rRNA maturation RNase YbeY [Candidatus Levybacteria bacterium RIFCSPLOWO